MHFPASRPHPHPTPGLMLVWGRLLLGAIHSGSRTHQERACDHFVLPGKILSSSLPLSPQHLSTAAAATPPYTVLWRKDSGLTASQHGWTWTDAPLRPSIFAQCDPHQGNLPVGTSQTSGNIRNAWKALGLKRTPESAALMRTRSVQCACPVNRTGGALWWRTSGTRRSGGSSGCYRTASEAIKEWGRSLLLPLLLLPHTEPYCTLLLLTFGLSCSYPCLSQVIVIVHLLWPRGSTHIIPAARHLSLEETYYSHFINRKITFRNIRKCSRVTSDRKI